MKAHESLCAEADQERDGRPLSEHDKRLCGNPQVLASVERGLADSAAGWVSKRASYAEHADDVLEDGR